jgi:hypothetical protein
MAARKKRSTRKGMVRRTARRAYKKNTPTRRRRKNPKAGLSPADIRDLGSAAAGGVGAGILTTYLEANKPAALAQVPTEIVAAALGVTIAAFGKTPIMKNLSAGMISFAAGNWAANMTKAKVAPAGGVPGLYSPNVGALHHVNTRHLPHHHHGSTINVGGLTFAVEE